MNYKYILFDLDGTLYFNKGFKKKIILKSIKKMRFMYEMQRIRKEIKGKDFKSKEKFYKYLFKNISIKLNKNESIINELYFKFFYITGFFPQLGQQCGKRNNSWLSKT